MSNALATGRRTYLHADVALDFAIRASEALGLVFWALAPGSDIWATDYAQNAFRIHVGKSANGERLVTGNGRRAYVPVGERRTVAQADEWTLFSEDNDATSGDVVSAPVVEDAPVAATSDVAADAAPVQAYGYAGIYADMLEDASKAATSDHVHRQIEALRAIVTAPVSPTESRDTAVQRTYAVHDVIAELDKSSEVYAIARAIAADSGALYDLADGRRAAQYVATITDAASAAPVVAEAVAATSDVADAAPAFGPRGEVHHSAPSREGNGSTRTWNRRINGKMFSMTIVDMPDGEKRVSVSVYTGSAHMLETGTFASDWKPVRFTTFRMPVGEVAGHSATYVGDHKVGYVAQCTCGWTLRGYSMGAAARVAASEHIGDMTQAIAAAAPVEDAPRTDGHTADTLALRLAIDNYVMAYEYGNGDARIAVAHRALDAIGDEYVATSPEYAAIMALDTRAAALEDRYSARLAGYGWSEYVADMRDLRARAASIGHDHLVSVIDLWAVVLDAESPELPPVLDAPAPTANLTKETEAEARRRWVRRDTSPGIAMATCYRCGANAGQTVALPITSRTTVCTAHVAEAEAVAARWQEAIEYLDADKRPALGRASITRGTFTRVATDYLAAPLPVIAAVLVSEDYAALDWNGQDRFIVQMVEAFLAAQSGARPARLS